MPPSPLWRACGGCTRGWSCPPAAADRRPAVVRVGPVPRPQHLPALPRYPVAWTVEAWRQAGFADVGTRLMSLGGGLVMWGQRRWLIWPSGRRRPGTACAAYLRGPAGRMAGLVDAAASAVHGVAPVVRGDRGGAGAAGLGQPPAGHGGGVLPGRRGGRARPGRTQRAAAADRDPGAGADRGGRGRAWPARSASASTGITRVGWSCCRSWCAGPVLVVAYNAELFGGIIHNDLGFAAAWGAFPALTGYVAQTGRSAWPRWAAAAAALRTVGRPAPAEHAGPVHPAPRGRGQGHDHAGRWQHRPHRPGPDPGPAGRGAAGDVLGTHPARGGDGRRPAALIRRNHRASGRTGWVNGQTRRLPGISAGPPLATSRHYV